MVKRLMAGAGWLAAMTCAASLAVAQPVPYRERPGAYERGYARDGQANRRPQAGVFDYYVLALSWSPSYCADVRGGRHEPQCDGRRERPYSFVLHGLWPQYDRGWPQDCRSADRGYVPRPVANRMLDIMPSARLVFNEYRKHGTCSGLGVDGYFDLARQLYESVKIPSRFVGLTDDRLTISPAELVREFTEANPKLAPDMVAVVCRGPGNRLREVRICFDKGGRFRACGHNEDQQRLCSAGRMYVPPVRTGPDDGSSDRRRNQEQDLLPGPREERRL